MYASPLQTMVQDGEELLRTLDEAARNLEFAIEQRFAAGRKLAEVEQTYKDMESEYLAEMIFDSDGPMRNAKNAEQRSIVQDAELVKARTSGALAPAWNMLNRAKTEQVNAQMAYEQMEVRYKASSKSSDLRAAILLTFAKG